MCTSSHSLDHQNRIGELRSQFHKKHKPWVTIGEYNKLLKAKTITYFQLLTWKIHNHQTRRHKDIKINELKTICDEPYFFSTFIFYLLNPWCLESSWLGGKICELSRLILHWSIFSPFPVFFRFRDWRYWNGSSRNHYRLVGKLTGQIVGNGRIDGSRA